MQNIPFQQYTLISSSSFLKTKSKKNAFWKKRISNKKENFFKKEKLSKRESKLTNRRIWTEVFKVLIASDVILFILDSRDPIGTWCDLIQKKTRKLNKFMVIVLNKCDLVPAWIISKWEKIFSKEYNVVSFHSDLKSPSGKGVFLNLFRQIKNTHFSNKNSLLIGVVGYPNVGKSAFINSLKGAKIVSSSPILGETKVWQFVKLLNNVFLIDSPGIIPHSHISLVMKIFRGGVRQEKIQIKNFFYFSIIKKMKSLLGQNYLGNKNKKSINFPPEILLKKYSKLNKGGLLDNNQTFSLIIQKFLEGKFPWHAPIPLKLDGKNQQFLKKNFWIYYKNLKFL